jgi:hypothetical protein
VAVTTEDLLLMATAFARDVLALERDRQSAGTGASQSSFAILREIVSPEDETALRNAIGESGGLALLAEIFALALDRGDELSPPFSRALEAMCGDTYSQQGSVREALSDYVPYLILAAALIRLHYSTAHGLEIDIPNPAINQVIERVVERAAAPLGRLQDLLPPRPKDGRAP